MLRRVNKLPNSGNTLKLMIPNYIQKDISGVKPIIIKSV